MGYATLYECGTKYKTPFFTPTGPLLQSFVAKRLPFAVRSVSRITVRTRYIAHRPCPPRSPVPERDTVLSRYYM